MTTDDDSVDDMTAEQLAEITADLKEKGISPVPGVVTSIGIGVIGGTVIMTIAPDGEGEHLPSGVTLGMSPARALTVGSTLVAAAQTAAIGKANQQGDAIDTAEAAELFLKSQGEGPQEEEINVDTTDTSD